MRRRFHLIVSLRFLLFLGWTWFFAVGVVYLDFEMALALAVLFTLYGGIW